MIKDYIKDKLKATYLWRVVKSISDRGVLKTAKLVYFELMPWIKFGVDMRGVIHPPSLLVHSRHAMNGYRCEAVNYYIFKKIFRAMNMDFGRSLFVDFGAGKGQAMIWAAELGFGEVIGVEFSPMLVDICSANFMTYLQHSHRKIKYQIVNADAADYDIPQHADVLFFFNPFDETVMRNVVNNILRSHFAKTLFIVYVNAIHRVVFEEHGFEKIMSFHENELDLYTEGGTYIYRKQLASSNRKTSQ